MKHKIQSVKLANGHEFFRPTDEEIKGYKYIVEIVIQETMTKAEYDKHYPAISKGLDDAITDELRNEPKSIMGNEK